MAWYLCERIGDGKSLDTAYRPALARTDIPFSAIDVDGNPKFLVNVDDELAALVGDMLQPCPPELLPEGA